MQQDSSQTIIMTSRKTPKEKENQADKSGITGVLSIGDSSCFSALRGVFCFVSLG